MSKTKYLLLAFLLLISLAFRFYINYFIPIKQPVNLLIIFIGLVNLILLFNIVQRSVNVKVALLAALLYAISPWTAYLELVSSPYVFLLALLVILYTVIQMFNVNKKFFLTLVILIILIFIFWFNQIAIFSDVGLINTVNTYRGETSQTVFAPIGKIIENRYIYLSEHLIFNILKQFTPATYFTNQAQMLGFSFAPPIYLGLIPPFLFGLVKVIGLIPKKNIFEVIILGIFLLLPSILSKNSPDLSRLILISPIIFFTTSFGLYEFILNFKKRLFRFLLFLTIAMVVLQFLTTLSDIAIRESVRLQMILN